MKSYLSRCFAVTAVLAAFVICTACAPALAQKPAGDGSMAQSALYQRMGGYDFVARFVDTAFPRVAGDPQLNRLFRGHSRDSQLRQRQLVIDALCQAAGGPCIYLGRPMKPLHAGLGITAADWDVFMQIVSGALDEFTLAAPEKQEFLALFEQRRDEVIDTQ